MGNEVIESNGVDVLLQLQEELKSQQDLFLQQQKELLSKESVLSSTSGSNTLSFTQGLIVGQLSVIVVIAIFVKFFVFQDASHVPTSVNNKEVSGVIKKRENKKSLHNNNGNERFDDENNENVINSILEKTYYDVSNHSSESLDWFNVLIAQFINQARNEALIADNIFHSLNDYLLKSDFPDYLDSIKISEIDIGDDFPILSNCRIVQSPENLGRLQAKIDIDLSDTITLGVETRLLINYPKPMTAALPIKLSVTLVRFSGCLSISLINPNDPEYEVIAKDVTPEPEEKESRLKPETLKSARSMSSTSGSPRKEFQKSTPIFNSTSTVEVIKPEVNSNIALMLEFSPDYRLEFTIKSLIGSRAKLEDVPKISSLIEGRLRQWFVERCVEPHYKIIKIPSIWPNKGVNPSDKNE
ncbi:maintenance of mitochondrial morphology protein 1 [[Candida] jaroonii]|uniref:Maintenance of mitochondrial morphology protein 1 n=1 Tax=[Candida] jaroonii TaxID=467808 RepID=A0ACA9Y249_9ASCO|nr:maintenance of mitochondrial morphology protein 1 [[Candida] jaroonii]